MLRLICRLRVGLHVRGRRRPGVPPLDGGTRVKDAAVFGT